jgi:lectin-like protein
VVSGNNGFAGIAICGAAFCGGGEDSGSPIDASGNVIRGNFVGVTADGSAPLGNKGYGVSLDGAPNTLVGGTAPGAGNAIAFSGDPQTESIRSGVVVFNPGATGNQILANSIYSNTGLGIDLGSDGVTANDEDDADTGPNDLQNSPVLTIVTSGVGTSVGGRVNTGAGRDVRVDFYSSPTCDPSGYGEGTNWIGTITTPTGVDTFAPIDVVLEPVPDGMFITATATTIDGTSEFSGCRMVLPPGLVEWPVSEGGNGHVYEYVTVPGSWTTARAAAAARSFRGVAGHLVTVGSAAENTVVVNLRGNGDLRGWIGLTDEVVEGTFQWITGEPVDYTNWNSGEPNAETPGEDYVEMFAASVWNDIENGAGVNQGYLVEYDVDPFTAPGITFAVTPNSTVFSLDGTPVPVNGTVTNNTARTQSIIVIQHFIDQGNLTVAAAGWQINTQSDDASGTISAQTTRTLIPDGHAANAGLAAQGGIQPGAAMLRIQLRQQVGNNTVVLGTIAVPITIVP